MKLTSLATRLLVVFASLTALAFSGDNESFHFSLSSNRIFAPGDPEIAVEISGNQIGGTTVKFRAFRISDPVEFFLAQKDPHSPSLLALVPPNTFEMIRQGVDKVERDARYAARDVMPADARRAIRDAADLNGTKAEKRDAARAKTSTKTKPTEPSGDDIPKGAERYEVVTQWQHRVAPRKDQWTYESVKVPIKEKGVYLIEARTRGSRAVTALVISEYGMVIKQANDKALAWVTNRRSGEKVSGFDLTVARAGKIFAEKATGGDGLIEVPIPPSPPAERPADADPDEWRWMVRNRQLLVLGEKDGNFVISDPYYYGDEGQGRQTIYLHTDRPVYRPAQKVFYRGIVRGITTDGTYETPTSGDIAVEVRDARDGVVRRDTLRLNDMGTFNGELVLGDEPPLGTYTIRVRTGEEDHWFNFAVEEYKKPEYKVEVTTDRGQYTRGDAITATVKAEYFFGSPVANAQVEYFVYRAKYWRPWWRGSDWAYLYEESSDFYTYRMEMIQSQEATLNPDGTLQITVPTSGTADDDYVYRIQANVVDNSRRSISGAKSVEVTRGEFYITTRTDKYVYRPGEDARINVGIATFDGDRPVASPFTVRVTRTWWDPIKTGTETEYKRRTQTIWSGSGATDAKGEGIVSYKATEPGYFEVEVAARDARGTSITESSYIYVADQTYANWYREGSSDVQVIPDKQSYSPGETMSALVIMPAANVDALITAEGATIYRYSVERLSANSAIVRMPIEERFAPVFYLNASTIVNDELYTESQRITVVPKGRTIRLEVETDKSLYRPAERGSVTVRALDEDGRPVADVDVALAMVDEAVYSIMPDATQEIQRFFYGNRWNEVSTSSSLAFNFYGDARRMASGDALLSAAPASAESGAANKQMADASGRDGARTLAFGDVKGQMFVQPAMRRNFQDMMFWTPSARTGADGRVRLDVNFPDNLTTWRITARGVTRNTAVGQSVSRVVARKDLLVRMETPRFLIQGDELVISTTVHNYLSSAKQTKVEFSGTNVKLAESSRTISIAANGEQRLDWRITAPSTGTATLTVKALTNEESDAVELPVPVLPRGLRVTTGESGEFDDRTGSGTLTLTLPEQTEPSSGELAVTVTPSLAGSLLGALDELIGYPYGCVEQTMSRFLPTIVVARTLDQLNVPFDQGRRAEIPRMANAGLQRLYGMQNEEGGWGWWSNDGSDVFMTAYVSYGLHIARQAGFAVDEQRQTRGLDALRRAVLEKPTTDRGQTDQRRSSRGVLDATTESYALYVLSLASEGAPQKAVVDRISTLARRDTINNYARALLALASRSAGLTSQAASLVAKLEGAATESGTSTYWKGKGWHYSWQDDMVETTALTVNAILAVRGETEQVRRGIRWLLSQREGDAWHNTRQTAMVIYSLSDYLRASRELDPDYTYVVKVNGAEVGTGRFTRADVYGEGRVIKLDRSKLRTGANTVTVEKSGAGKLYSAARLSYYATGSAIQQASAGYRVTREYSLLRKERQGDVYVYTKRPFSGTVRTGDEIFVKVTVRPDAAHDYFMLEDPLPAGCEVVSNTDGYTIPGEPMYDEKARHERGWYGWYWWYADREVRDEKVAFFARWMPVAEQEFSYIMRAQIPGRYSVMPSVGALMYYPEVRGNSGPIALTIVE